MKTGQISIILPVGQKLLFSSNLCQITVFQITTFEHKIPPNNLSGIIIFYYHRPHSNMVTYTEISF